MRIKIDSKKISYSYDNIENIVSNFNEEILKQLEQQITNGNNSCLLVSGYRGTGKTSLIRKLENDIKDSKIIFINLNLPKYEGYSLILRKLIRQIYLKVLSSENYSILKKNNPDLIENMEALYEHTFYEVFNNSSLKKIKEFSIHIKGDYNINDIIKKSLPLLILLLSTFNLNYNLIPEFINNSNVLIEIASLIWSIYSLIKISISFIKKNSHVEELNRKSLYDDEIAEYHLRNILEQLNEEGIKIVFVFDELDKIEDESEINRIISDLKPLLLSNLASFIIISGQKLYYKFIESNLLDDSLMASIFSKNIHIPLATNIVLEKLFDYYTDEENYTKKYVVEKYIDSLILNSNKIIRKFNNLILQDIVWEDNYSYLYIEEESLKSFDTDSIILNILTEIIEKNIDDDDDDDGIKDFLTHQLFVWINKMKLKWKVYFSKSEIFNFEKDYSSIYPHWCEEQLEELFEILINCLLEKNMLERKENNTIYYKWTKKAYIKVKGINNKLNKIEWKVIEEIIEIEEYCKGIYVDLLEESIENRDFISIINRLYNMGIISDGFLDDKMRQLFKIKYKINDAEELSNNEKESLLSCSYYIKMKIYDLIEEYCFYIINRYLKKYKYNVIRNRDYRDKDNLSCFSLDIIAENNSVSNVVFEIKYRNNYSYNDANMIYGLIKKLISYNEITKKKNKLVIFWFSKKSRKSFDVFHEKVNRIIDDEFAELKEHIFLFYASEYRSNFNHSRMESYLEKVITETVINQDESEIAATTND